ncbi:MAG: threonine synthase [Sutterellaceae bacterium]|nr:threonine synthase [Sutterellaceae bacterium]
MTYVSTRGEDDNAGYSDIVLKGLAADGGLFLPRQYPKVESAELESWRKLSYAELAFEVLRRFATDIDEGDLKKLLAGVYREDVYNNGREGEDFSKITPVHAIDGGNIHLLELSNGPTLAFKDMAMQYLGALFEYLLAKKGGELNILGATSGDTGSAAEYAMRSRKGIRVFMLSPEGRMSAFQRAQMYSLDDANIFNIAVKGAFDDAQDVVKACSRDAVFKNENHIGTVNSINWARISAQVVYYFKGWLEVTEKPGEVIDVTVPSGNFGNILAGWIAKQMGLPIGQLVVATNENDVLHEFFTTGTYRVRDGEHTYVTSSPSMDISKASNFERYVYDIVGKNAGRINELWTMVALKGGFTLTESEFFAVRQSGFTSARSTHADRLATIAELYRKEGFMVDPHTADGIKAAREKKRDGVKMLALETALPAKFAETMREAVGVDPQVPASYVGIEAKPQKVVVMAADADRIKAFIKENIG